jgi:hypothetical protein
MTRSTVQEMVLLLVNDVSVGRTRTTTCTAGEVSCPGRGVIGVRGVRGTGTIICPMGVFRMARDGMPYRAAMLLAPRALLKPRLEVGGVDLAVRGDSMGVVEDMGELDD